MDNLADLVSDWPVESVAVAVFSTDQLLGSAGNLHLPQRIASVSKLLVAYGTLLAWEEGTITLDEPAGPPDSTVRHLLAHASGLAFDSDQTLILPGRKRIYSNTGIEALAEFISSQAEMPLPTYLCQGVLEQLDMKATVLEGSPAHGYTATVSDLVVFGQEILRPQLITADTLDVATTIQFPELSGVLPGIGSFSPNPWGLGFEIKGAKTPHWTGSHTSSQTFGHFGGSGSFFWIDPTLGIGAVGLTNRDFDRWAMEAWPRFSDTVISRYG